MPKKQELPKISPLTLWFFRRVARRYFRKHFRSVMVQGLEWLREARGPLIVFANHSSWWDPLLMVLLARVALPGRQHYAPMDAEALKRYPIFRRLGIFPVEMSTARGAAMFLRTSTAVLEAGGVLWMTPQGRFVDSREVLEFKPGLGALAARMPGVTLLPMAIEYTFWDERLPETLVRFGEPIKVGANQPTRELEEALEAEMRTLQGASMARDASAFEVMVSGGRGTGGVYALGRRIWSFFGGKSMQQDHTLRGE